MKGNEAALRETKRAPPLAQHFVRLAMDFLLLQLMRLGAEEDESSHQHLFQKNKHAPPVEQGAALCMARFGARDC